MKLWCLFCLKITNEKYKLLSRNVSAVLYLTTFEVSVQRTIYLSSIWLFLSKVNICNVYCARTTSFIFDTRTDVLVKVSECLRQKMSRPERDPNLRMHADYSNHLRHLLFHVLNTGSGDIDIFEVKLTFEMCTVCGQQCSFLTHKRMFLWKCERFGDRKCLDLRGTRISNLRIIQNALTIWAIRAKHLLSHVLNTGSDDIDCYLVPCKHWRPPDACGSHFIFCPLNPS